MYTFLLRLICIITLFQSCTSDRPRTAAIHLSPEDSAKVDSLNHIYFNNRYSDQSKTLSALQTERTIYKKYDTDFSNVEFYYNMVAYYTEVRLLDSAKRYVDSQLQQNVTVRAANLSAMIYATKGFYFSGLELWDSAISNNLQALALLKDNPDYKMSLNLADAICLAYIHQENYEKAFYYYRPYIDELNKPGGPARKLDILLNIFAMGNDSGSDSLKVIGDRCLFMAKRLADSICLENAQPVLDYNLANYYFRVNNVDSGIYYSNKALDYIRTKKTNGDHPELVYEQILNNLIAKDKYSQASAVYKEMQQNTDTAQYTRESKSNYYQFAYLLELKNGSLAAALKALQQLKTIDDEISKYKNSDLLLKYEAQTERLANENFVKQKEYEAKRQRYYAVFVTIIAILALASSIFIYYNWRKKRLLEQMYWRQQQKQQEMEHKGRLWEERNRIAREMHDDLGATLTATFLAVEMAEIFPGEKEHLQMIRNTTSTLYQQISEVIWNLNMQNDEIGSLNNYMLRFANDFLNSAGIKLNWNNHAGNTSKFIPGFQRRIIYLSFKELINNIVKHAQATVVKVSAALNGDIYQLTIEDNGIGIQSCMEQEDVRYGSTGYGLTNIRHNISRIAGTVNWQQVDVVGGSRVTISVLIADE